MTRKKVKLAYITNDSERKASFKKRKKGLIKKVSELSTLCGVDACAIIYSQYDAEPTVWPSPLGAQAVLARFRKLSEMDQGRKMVNMESFTRQRVRKLEEQIRRLRKENKRRELENFMLGYLVGMSTMEEFKLADATEMAWVTNQVIRDIVSRKEALKRNEHAPAPPLPLPAPPMEQSEAMMYEENMESFPWNLVQSPGAGGFGLGLDEGALVGMMCFNIHTYSTITLHLKQEMGVFINYQSQNVIF